MNQNRKSRKNGLDDNASTSTRLGLFLFFLLATFAYMFFTGTFDGVVEAVESIEEKVKESNTTDVDDSLSSDMDIEEETDLEIPFSVIEEVPIFPGCKGSTVDKKNCFSKKVRKHVGKHFNTELANELGLNSGKKRIYVRFKIDKNGNVTDIHAKAPHPKLKEEGIRVISKLPKLVPGIHNGKAVSVAYTLPITFNVD